MDTAEKKETATEMPLSIRGYIAAKSFLVHRGYEILEDGYSCKQGEIDFIAMDGDDCLCFIEVITRRAYDNGGAFPDEALGEAKRRRFENIAACYLMTSDCASNTRIRFDIISIRVLNEDRSFIRFHKNVLGKD